MTEKEYKRMLHLTLIQQAESGKYVKRENTLLWVVGTEPKR